MNNFKLLTLAMILSACGADTNTVKTVTVEKEVEVLVPVEEAPVKCQVFKNRVSNVLPTIHQVKGDLELELENLQGFSEVDEVTPFEAFEDTEAEAVVSNFALRCLFKFEVKTAGSHKFNLTSDDGSELYINGSRLINNSGSHGMTLKTGTITLPEGVHELRLMYQQGNGNKGLTLTVQEPSVVPPASDL